MHSCFSLHEKEEIQISFDKEKQKIYYLCKKCNKLHITKIYKNEPIFLGCCLENESITLVSWNTWSNKYCTQCNDITKGLIRGHCWYCNNCNT